MPRPLFFSLSLITLLALSACNANPAAQASSPSQTQGAAMTTQSLYDIPVKTITGEQTTLAQYKGKTLLIVNVASECGFTKQYPGLQSLWEREKANGLVVLGFPSNDFGGQEPGSDEEIAAFCTGGKYNVDFPMFSKIQVKPGPEQHPLYALLTSATGEQVSWNFNKFLVGPDGQIVRRFDSRAEPESEAILDAIRALR